MPDTSRSPQELSYIEPGLLAIFSTFMLIQWVILMLAFCSLSNGGDAGNAVLVTLMLAHTTLLLLYLRWRWLQRKLGRLFLPLALIGATITPIIVRFLGVAARLEDGLRGVEALSNEGGLLLWLATPLIVVAAQYRIRGLIIFTIISTSLELLAAAILADIGDIPMRLTVEAEITRNIIFVAIGYIISRLINEQRRQRASLEEANEQLKQFAATLEQLAISRERNRVARELHDTLAHTLSAVSIQLEAVTAIWDKSPDKAKERIITIQQATREGLAETRRALQALRTSPIDDLGLLMALSHLAEKSAADAGFTLHQALPPQLPELPSQIELNLYRIAEEAFNNIVNHAEASHVWLKLQISTHELSLVIRDNGNGFDTQQPPPERHYGLTGMRERAELIAAILSVQSEQHIGTTIELKVAR